MYISVYLAASESNVRRGRCNPRRYIVLNIKNDLPEGFAREDTQQDGTVM